MYKQQNSNLLHSKFGHLSQLWRKSFLEILGLISHPARGVSFSKERIKTKEGAVIKTKNYLFFEISEVKGRNYFGLEPFSYSSNSLTIYHINSGPPR